MKTRRHPSPLSLFATLGFAAALLTALLTSGATAPSPEADGPLHEQVALFLDQHCATCHNDTDTEGDLDIVALKFDPQDPKNLKTWQDIYDQTETGDMPPKEKRQPREAQKKEFLTKVDTALKAAQK